MPGICVGIDSFQGGLPVSSVNDGAKPNRLIKETSPYLLQHAYNPVDWYPWCDEALNLAKEHNKPILLSVGYSACHWCHVMERESFQDEKTAGLMNEHMINIKVDREERPDIDHIYQTAAQLLSGGGGWPLTVFLTPDLRPFYAGTYFPPEERFGKPAFSRLIETLIKTYHDDPERIEKAANQLTDAIREVDSSDTDENVVSEQGPQLLSKAADWLVEHFDDDYGGFGSRPKFPNTPALDFLMRQSYRTGDQSLIDKVCIALDHMMFGGIYDQLGGGFHRYSVDERWMVPHFEKMLHDNALLPLTYIQAFRHTGDLSYERVVRETLAYVDREMSHPEGGFYSSQDADSEGDEGTFFVWRSDEIKDILGEEDAILFCDAYGVTPSGNFERGSTVLHHVIESNQLGEKYGVSSFEVEARLNKCREMLFNVREKRVKPDRDDKVITGWSSLMLLAFSEAGKVFDEPGYVERAKAGASFIKRYLVEEHRLLRTYKDRPGGVGYLDDYAYFVRALISLYEVTLDRIYLHEAVDWTDRLIELFWDDDKPGFFMTPSDHERLIVRPRDWRDQSLPSGTAIAVTNLIKLHRFVDRKGYEHRAGEVLVTHQGSMDQNPWGTASLLLGYDLLVHDLTEVVIVAAEDQQESVGIFAKIIGRQTPPSVMHVISPEDGLDRQAPLLWRGKKQLDGKVTVYVCRNTTCSDPITDAVALENIFAERSSINPISS